jgi:hypothetical protein
MERRRSEAKVPSTMPELRTHWRPEGLNDDAWMRLTERGTPVLYAVHHAPDGLVKLGTTTDLLIRLQSIQSSSPVPLVLRDVCFADVGDEYRLHQRFADERRHGEWFDPSVLTALRSAGGLRATADGLVLVPASEAQRAVVRYGCGTGAEPGVQIERRGRRGQ